MSLLLNILSRFVLAFLPRSKRLLISWLQSPSTVILEPKKIKCLTVSIVSPSICHEVMGLDAMIFQSASLVAQRLMHVPAMQETWVRSLGQEDALEKEMAAHSSILPWRIPWTEEPGGLQSMGSQESDTTTKPAI